MPYAIKKDSNGKIVSCQTLSKTYVEQYKDDPSNPLNKGYELVQDLNPADIPKRPITPVLTQEDYDNIKKLRKGV